MKNNEVDVMKQLENKKYHKNYTWVIVLCIVLTFVIIVSSVWALCANLVPGKVADVAYKVNLNNYALKLYERDYDKSGDVDSLYMALNISIKTEKDDKVIELFETFYKDDDYKKYINFVNEQNLKLNIKPIVKATLLNEDNSLKNYYIQSLINKGEDTKAFRFALEDSLIVNPTYENMGNYLFANFCKKEVIDRFAINFRNIQNVTTLLGEIFNYMIALNDEFLEYGFASNDTEVYSWAMGNRILQVGSNVLILSEKTGITETGGYDIVEITSTIMDNVNKKFKLMSME